MASPDEALRARREATVMEHMRAEKAGDLDALCATFSHPRYRFAFTNEVHDGEVAVRRLIGDLLEGFPDLELITDELHHSDTAVILEGRMRGTHRGVFGGLPPTGRRIDIVSAIFFRFRGDEMYEECLYADSAAIFAQLTGAPPR